MDRIIDNFIHEMEKLAHDSNKKKSGIHGIKDKNRTYICYHDFKFLKL